MAFHLPSSGIIACLHASHGLSIYRVQVLTMTKNTHTECVSGAARQFFSLLPTSAPFLLFLSCPLSPCASPAPPPPSTPPLCRSAFYSHVFPGLGSYKSLFMLPL